MAAASSSSPALREALTLLTNVCARKSAHECKSVLTQLESRLFAGGRRAPQTHRQLYVTAITQLLHRRMIVDAVQLYDEMRTRPRDVVGEVDVYFYSKMLRAVAGDGQIDLMLRLYNEMPPNKRDVVSVGIVMDALADSGRIQELLAIHRTVKDSAVDGVALYNIILKALCRHDRVTDALRVFGRLGTRADMVTWSTIIRGLMDVGRVTDALAYFRRFRAITDDDDDDDDADGDGRIRVWNTVLTGLRNNRRYDDMRRLYDELCDPTAAGKGLPAPDDITRDIVDAKDMDLSQREDKQHKKNEQQAQRGRRRRATKAALVFAAKGEDKLDALRQFQVDCDARGLPVDVQLYNTVLRDLGVDHLYTCQWTLFNSMLTARGDDNGIPVPDDFSCNIVTMGLGEQDRLDEAIKLFHQRRRRQRGRGQGRGQEEEEEVVVAVASDDGQRLLPPVTDVSCSVLLRTLVRHDHITDALTLFDEMLSAPDLPPPNMQSWMTILRTCFKHNRVDDYMRLFSRYRNTHHHHHQQQHPQQQQQLETHPNDHDDKDEGNNNNSDNDHEQRRQHRSQQYRAQNTQLWNWALELLKTHGSVRECVDTFKDMLAACKHDTNGTAARPDRHTYATVLLSMVDTRDSIGALRLLTHIRATSHAISMPLQRKRAFETVMRTVAPEDQHLLFSDTMIAGGDFAANGGGSNGDDAVVPYPSKHEFTLVLKSLADNNHVDECLQAMYDLLNDPMCPDGPTPMVWNRVVQAAARANHCTESAELLQRMCTNTPHEPDLVTWTMVLQAMQRAQRYTDSNDLYQLMVKRGRTSPDTVIKDMMRRQQQQQQQQQRRRRRTVYK